MEKYSKAVLTDAKQEYTNELKKTLVEPIYKFIKNIYNIAKNDSVINNLNTLKTFQILLAKTPTWNGKQIENETTKIIKESECDYLEDLLTAVFVTHTKILVSIKYNNPNKMLDLNVPKISHFIHRVLIQCARNFWRQPWLLHTGYTSLDLQRNLIESEKIIKDSINETIRDLLPVRELLKQYLGDNFSEENYSNYADDDITSVVSIRTKKNIKKLLKHEMDTLLKEDTNEDFSRVSVAEPLEENIEENVDKQETLFIEKDDKINKETTMMIDRLNSLNETGTQTEPINSSDKSEENSVIENTLLQKNITEKSATEDAEPEVEKKSIYDNLSPENFDNRTIDEIALNNKRGDTINDVRTELEEISVLNDIESNNSNSLYKDFSFFQDAADF